MTEGFYLFVKLLLSYLNQCDIYSPIFDTMVSKIYVFEMFYKPLCRLERQKCHNGCSLLEWEDYRKNENHNDSHDDLERKTHLDIIHKCVLTSWHHKGIWRRREWRREAH